MRLRMSPKNMRIPCRPRKVILGLRGKATRQTAGRTMTGDAGMAKNGVRPMRPQLHPVWSQFLGSASEVENRLIRPGAAELLRPLIDNGGKFPHGLRLRKFRTTYFQHGMDDIRTRSLKRT